MTEQENVEATPAQQAGTAWFNILGAVPGDIVMIVPTGSMGGQGFQGELVALVSDDTGPLAVIIRQRAGAPNVTIRWGAICMFTKVDKTDEQAAAENAELARIQAEFEAKTGISVEDVENLANA